MFVRRYGHNPQDAQDLVQGFFAKVLEKNYFGDANPQKGRFGSFLLIALKRFMVNEWHRSHSQKRGGGRRGVIAGSEPIIFTIFRGSVGTSAFSRAHYSRPLGVIPKNEEGGAKRLEKG